MKFIQQYVRELIILVLVVVLGTLVYWNVRARGEVEDLKRRNREIKEQLTHLVEKNEWDNAIYQAKRDSLNLVLDSLLTELPADEKRVEDMLKNIKSFSTWPSRMDNNQKDSIWNALKEEQ